MGSVEPSAERLAAFTADADTAGAIVMINLLRYRDRAAYPLGIDAAPCPGREAYQRYVAHVAPMLAAVGGRIVWFGNVKHTVIAPDGERWDDAILVEYPSRAAFLGMVSRPDYQQVAIHRTVALEDSRLIATATALSAF
jgi:uncharacterized protein (DUF1330 family)